MYFDLINIFQKYFVTFIKKNENRLDDIWWKWIYSLSNRFSSYLPHPMHSPYFKTNKMCNISALGLVLLNILMICIKTQKAFGGSGLFNPLDEPFLDRD